ncbi:MAG TPA: hypothetical protein HA304_02170 [Methanosarcinales archaeon]|nr:hypothetical protein [Methanosarcinales archaeon]
MYDDIGNISRAFHRHRFYYKLADFIVLSLILYTLSYYFNVVSLFSQYIEYYIVDTVSLDEILVMALSILVSAVLVIILYIRKPAIDTIGMIESRYEWMQERLKAACDTRNEDNIVAADLRNQVTSGLKAVDAGLFLNRRYLLTMIIASVVLTVVSAGLFATQTHVDITPKDITALVDELGGNLPESTFLPGDNQTSSSDGGLDEDIYGDTSIASIEGENVELLIIPGIGTSVTIRHAGQDNGVQFVPSQTYPVDVVSSNAADESYQSLQQLSVPDRNLIREYVIRLSQQ